MPDELTPELIGHSVLGPVSITRAEDDHFQYLKGKGHARQRILNCQQCPRNASGLCTGPVPPELPRSRPNILVVGEAPGPKEYDKGVPFVGKSGTYLRTKFTRLGFDLQTIGYTNAVSCWPTRQLPVGRGYKRVTRSPDKTELASCRANLFDVLHASQPRFVLLAGAVPLRAFRPDLKLNRSHGKVFVWEASWLVLPTYHPAGALRKGSGSEASDAIHDDLEILRLLVKGEIEPYDAVSPWCIKCGEEAVKYDPNLAGFCADHWHGNESNWHSSTYEGWRNWYEAHSKKDKKDRSKQGAALAPRLFDD